MIELNCLEDMAGKDVAEKLNIHPGTVRSQLHKARQLLKDAMKENYKPIKE
jgi:DNA-directed RNA polymerase specialized sigma24 family protein